MKFSEEDIDWACGMVWTFDNSTRLSGWDPLETQLTCFHGPWSMQLSYDHDEGMRVVLGVWMSAEPTIILTLDPGGRYQTPPSNFTKPLRTAMENAE